MNINYPLLVAWLIFIYGAYRFMQVRLMAGRGAIKNDMVLQSNYLGVIAVIVIAIAVKLLFA